MRLKHIIIAVVATVFTLHATKSAAQEAPSNNSPKEYYQSLLVQQHNIANEINSCNDQMHLLSNGKAKKMTAYIDNLKMQNVSIARQLEMFPKSFSDPSVLTQIRKEQDIQFMHNLERKALEMGGEQNSYNIPTTDAPTQEFYSVLFAIADEKIPMKKYPQQTDVFIKEVANNKIAHFVGRFNEQSDAEDLKNSILDNTYYKEAIVVLIK